MDYRKNLCPLPWIELSANSDTTLRVCCNTYHGGHVLNEDNEYTSITSDETLVELFNKKTHRDLRVSMMKGERPHFCKSCYDREDYGGFSIRQSYYEQYGHLIDDIVSKTNTDGTIDIENINLKKIDLSLSNLCNLKCRMCSPLSSTALKKEFDDTNIDYSPETYDNAATKWRLNPGFKMIFEHHCSHVENILTTGGEPFLAKDHRDILRILKSKNLQKNIKLSYHTSLTILPEELIELWRGFKEININLSLEGIRETNDYARHPSKWEEIMANLQTLASLKPQINITLNVHSCIQALTWPNHHQLLFFTAKLNQLDSNTACLPYPIWLENPAELSALNLPPALKEIGIRRNERALKYIKRLIKRPFSDYEQNIYDTYIATFKRLREHQFNEEDFWNFKERVMIADEYRQHDITKVMPEFIPYFTPEDFEKLVKVKNIKKAKKLEESSYPYLMKNDFSAAEVILRNAYLIDPTNSEVLYNLGYCLKNLNRGLEANNFFRQTLHLNPDHYFALIEVGCDEMNHDHFEPALQLFNKALNFEPSFKLGETLLFIKQCNERKSQYKP